MIVRRTVLGLLLAIASVASMAAAPGGPSTAPRGGVVDRALQAAASSQRPDASVRVIVQSRRPADAISAVQQAAGKVHHDLRPVGGLAAEVRADRVDALARQPGVVRVMLDPPMRAAVDPPSSILNGPPSVFAQAVGADDLWSQRITGAGVAIAILDSGIRPHLDFGDDASRIVAASRFNNRAATAADQLGHGTWVAGIAAGAGTASNGRYRGIAPAASIVNLKVSDDTGAAYASDVVDALGWVMANRQKLNIRVVNLSMVSSVSEGYATSVLDAAVEMVWHSGVVVVVAAGNGGADTLRYAPANDPYVITVGATDDMATPWLWDDALAWFSSFGVTQDGFNKPDLVAPGRHIVGALASTGSMLAQQYPSKIIGQQYIQLSGTSAAAPMVTGAVALLAQVHPELTPDQVKWLLTHSARPLYPHQPGSGSGELSITAASDLASRFIGQANQGVTPNRLVGLAYLSANGQPGATWDSVSWGSVSWDSVSWDSVSWDSVSWDSVSWDSVSWDSVSWDSVYGD